jgi:hypothetical protein
VSPILRGIGRVKLVEADLESSKIFLMPPMKCINQFLRCDAPLLRIDLDGGTMRVRGAHVDHVLPDKPEKSDVDVCLDIFHQVAYVNVTIGIRKGAGH